MVSNITIDSSSTNLHFNAKNARMLIRIGNIAVVVISLSSNVFTVMSSLSFNCVRMFVAVRWRLCTVFDKDAT